MSAEGLILVTGVSGAGKSQAVRALEMLGYTCTDNLPPALLPDFLRTVNPAAELVAVVLDARGVTAADIPALVARVRDLQTPHRMFFLDADDETLIRRFSETRRRHPLDDGSGLRAAIATERQLLGELRELAEVIDTGELRVDQLVSRLQESVDRDGGATGTLPVTLMSFGFKHGVPTEADWVLDSRFLENPFYVPELRHLSGRDQAIRGFVLDSPLTAPFLEGAASLILPLLAGYREWGKPALTVAVGCTGGRHRSVVLVEELATRLDDQAVEVTVRHRDLVD